MLTTWDHLLALVIVLGLPLRAYFGMRALQQAPVASLAVLRQRLWWRAIGMQWLLVTLVVALWIVTRREFEPLGLLLRPTAGLTGVLVGTATIVSLVLRQRKSLDTDAALRARVRDRLAPVERLMPRNRGEFPLFSALALTAGVCEEFLFRGFLLWYMAQWMPLLLAALLQGVAFGVGHAYQGARGIMLTGVAGLFFTGVRLVAVSLWPAMLIHALMDLHAGDLACRVFRVEPTEPGTANAA